MKTSSYSPSTTPAVPPDQAYRGAEGQTLSIDTNGPFYAKLFIFQKGPCLTGGVIHKNHFIKQTLFMRGLIPFRGTEMGSLAWIPKGEELISITWIQTQVAVPAPDNNILGLHSGQGKPCDSICLWNAHFHASEHGTQH